MDNDEVKIGAVVPVYNAEKWLDECLTSLVNQTKSFFEIVLIDDGSTDNSLGICENFENKYSGIRVYHQENGRQGKARNNGIAHSSSEYLLFVDSDDVLHPDTVEILSNIINKKRYDAVYFEAEMFGQREFFHLFRYNRELGSDVIEGTGKEFFSQSYPRSFFPSACLAAYRTALIKSAGIYFPEGVFYEDNYFSFVYMQEAEVVHCISDTLYGRRIREESTMTGKTTPGKIQNLCDVILAIYKYIDLHREEMKSEMYAIEQYMCDLCLSVWCRYEEYKSDISNYVNCNVDKLELVLKCYFELSEKFNSVYDERSLSCLVIEQKIILLVQKYASEHLISETAIVRRKEEGHSAMLKKYQELLKKLPLGDETAKVGIYGTGGHTEGLLNIYNALIGNVCSKLSFFETTVKNGNWKENPAYPVKSYLEINDTYDLIIISSFIYQSEMKKNALAVEKDCTLLCFYGDENRADIFSAVNGLL